MPEGRNFLHPSRERDFTEVVYGGPMEDLDIFAKICALPPLDPAPYQLYWGEIHGHTSLSDGQGTLDEYFSAARDEAHLDFCAVTDHDHGGPGRAELWGKKWKQTQQAVAKYHNPEKFVTLLGYERDSNPWYGNLCLYYRGGTGDMVLGEHPGEITLDELRALMARDDIIAIPHHTSHIGQGVNFECVPPELWTPLIEVYSKWGASEYWENPRPLRQQARFGHWQDALELGARMGCVGGSDVHSPHPGMYHESGGNIHYNDPGIVAVYAEDLSREAIFDAIKAKRCYAASGARIALDFRINDARMGQEIQVARGERRTLHVQVNAPEAIARVDIVKNARDYFVDRVDGRSGDWLFLVHDLKAERETDYYYVRVTQQDGRQAWSSPIWVSATD